LAIAWVLGHPQVTAVVVGPRRPEQLESALAATELELTQAERAELAGLFV
jgi:aryl-alcohol dehydrogenase-like predicted oxidoreductase